MSPHCTHIMPPHSARFISVYSTQISSAIAPILCHPIPPVLSPSIPPKFPRVLHPYYAAPFRPFYLRLLHPDCSAPCVRLFPCIARVVQNSPKKGTHSEKPQRQSTGEIKGQGNETRRSIMHNQKNVEPKQRMRSSMAGFRSGVSRASHPGWCC